MEQIQQTHSSPSVSSGNPQSFFIIVLVAIMALLIGGIGGYILGQQISRNTNPQTALPQLSPTMKPYEPKPTIANSLITTSPADSANWKTYTNEIFSFQYPSNWLGPEVDKQEKPYYISVGTSKPHTYGLNREDDYPKVDSYFVTVNTNYRDKSPAEWESEPWMARLTELLKISVGQSLADHGCQNTKIRDLTVDAVSASEFLVGYAPNGGGECPHQRLVIVKTKDLLIQVQGDVALGPVSINDKMDFSTTMENLEQKYYPVFKQILSTFRFTN